MLPISMPDSIEKREHPFSEVVAYSSANREGERSSTVN